MKTVHWLRFIELHTYIVSSSSQSTYIPPGIFSVIIISVYGDHQIYILLLPLLLLQFISHISSQFVVVGVCVFFFFQFSTVVWCCWAIYFVWVCRLFLVVQICFLVSRYKWFVLLCSVPFRSVLVCFFLLSSICNF